MTVGSAGLTRSATVAYSSSADAMYWVWNAPAVASGRTRARAGGSSASFSSAASAPAATIWPAALRLAGTRSSASRRASTSASSPPSRADMPVGSSAQALAISRPRVAARATASSAEMTPGYRVGGELADGVSGGDDLLGTGQHSARGQLLVGEQRGGHDEWLGHRGVGDLLGGGGGAQPRQIQTTDLRPRRDACSGAGQLQPLGEHAGCLRALSGREECKHSRLRHVSKKTL